MKWVGIFGGSFDPPHLGHLLASIYALKVFELDEIWLLPAYRHAFGKEMTSFHHRLEMCRRLIANLGSHFRVSDFERRIKSDGKTLNTLLALRRRRSEKFALVLGADALRDKEKWYKFSEIEQRFEVLVVPRTGFGSDKPAIPDVSSTEIRRRLKRNLSLEALLTPDVAAYIGKHALYGE